MRSTNLYKVHTFDLAPERVLKLQNEVNQQRNEKKVQQPSAENVNRPEDKEAKVTVSGHKTEHFQ